MQDAFIPVVFQRHSLQLRALMIDNRPWFVAYDFARLIAAPRALLLARRMPVHQRRTVLLQYDSGTREELDVISDLGAYNALFRFGHPEHRSIGQWLSEEVVPTLHDQHREADVSPKRAFMSWADQRVGVVRWQGELWIARRDLPRFMAAHDEPALRDGPSWRNLPVGDC
ncbi:BRO-N domain-containing protein [Pseudomonas sp. Q1-7]|uniref:BRO-N domain-containing protein n=1 Tax=Pseudomonas sp. Q1-7 TaxID=3020843 RepID=UPI002300DB5A|nr:BRO family protein [Pseudomonas sp. Q1-7]